MGDGQCAPVVLLEETDGVVLERTVFESNGRKAVHVHMMLWALGDGGDVAKGEDDDVLR